MTMQEIKHKRWKKYINKKRNAKSKADKERFSFSFSLFPSFSFFRGVETHVSRRHDGIAACIIIFFRAYSSIPVGGSPRKCFFFVSSSSLRPCRRVYTASSFVSLETLR